MNVVVLNEYARPVIDTPLDSLHHMSEWRCNVHCFVVMVPRVVVPALRRVSLAVARDTGDGTLPERVLELGLES